MKIFVTGLLLVLLIKMTYAQDFWQKLNSPTGGYIVSILLDSSNNLYAGTAAGGVYRSSDNGDNWTQINNGLSNFKILSFTYNNGIIFTGTNGGGVYHSSDNGNNWIPGNTGLSGRSLVVNSLAFDIYYTYAGTNSGLFHSTDNGNSWTPISGLSNARVTSLAVGNGYLHAATYGQGLYLSGDHGGNWNQVNNGLTGTALNINTLKVNSSYIFIGTDGDGVYRSSDNGNNWTQVINGMSKVRVFSIADDGTNIYAGTNNGIYRSSDNGDNWVRLTNGLSSLYGNALAFNTSYFFAGTNEGVYRSSDKGDNWTKANNGLNAVNILNLEVINNTIIAGTSGGLIRSSANGNSWAQISNGISFVRIYSLSYSDNYIFAGTNGGGIYRSSDIGDSWTQVNNGVTNLFGNALASGGGFIYTGTNAGIFRSSDKGDNWTQINNGLTNPGILTLAVASNFIYAGTSGGVFRSPDNGNNWTKVSNGLPNTEITALIAKGSFIFAGINGSGIYRSSNNGDNWTQVNNGVSNLNIDALAAGANSIYISTDGGGVYQSLDNGDNWTQVNGGLQTQRITTINTGKNGYLYTITYDPKISNGNGNGIYKSSNTVSASIAVTSPKGGENWQVGTAQTVTWTSANLSGNVNIKLSTDGGNSFPIVLASNTQSDNAENITIPNNPSANCRIKVESKDDTTIFGISPQNFTISLKPVVSITVTAPQTGANWTIGSQQTITWTSSNLTGNVNIRLSTDGGSTFPIMLSADTQNDGNDSITVPDKPSSTCRVRIESAADTSIYGINPGNFTITSKPTITVTSPQAGANWTIGTSQAVTWTNSNVTENVNIRLSTDGGSTFPITLLANTANNGSANVTVPNNPSTACRIKVESVKDTSVKGISPGNFTISTKVTITVTSPAAGGSWAAGTQQTITWTNGNAAGNVNIKLSIDGGASFPIILAANTPNDGSETITVPNNPSTACRIRVESISDTSNYGLNPGNFSITSKTSGRITVTAPPAGANWTIGSPQRVSWSSSGISGNVNIKLSVDGGNSFPIVLASNTQNDSSENITVPNNPSLICRIKIESVADSTIFGINPGNFSISVKPTISILTPQPGANWTIGSQQTITWTSNTSGNVNIGLSIDGGKTFPIALASNVSDGGSETITVPDNPSKLCRIKIESVSDTSVKAISSGNFTITARPSITVTAPQTGVSWTIGSQQTVSWTHFNVTGNINIWLSTDGGNSFAISLASGVANSGTANITTPDNPSSTCRVRVESAADTSINAISPGNFTITAKASITITNPAAGTKWTAGSKQTITWTNVNLTGNVNIKLSVDDGKSFPTALAEDTPNDGTETVSIPNLTSAACRIKIESVTDTSIFALNPGNFTIISKPTISVTSPQPGANWLTGSSQTVTWTNVNLTGNVNIKLSSDGGATFPVMLSANTQNDGSETITVPNNPSVSCKLKVESVDDTAVYSLSNTFSIIFYPATISVNSTITFGDIKDKNNYKIIGVPGSGSIPVSMSGDFSYDWTVYWDRGSDQNYLADSAGYTFAPGKAYWVLSKNPLALNKQVNTVPLNSQDISYSIPLHKGWNLISTPFDKSTKWQSVIALNKLSQNQLIYTWDGKGSYTNSSEMKPYEGYYYNNDSANFLPSLKIPYEPNGSMLRKTAVEECPVDSKKFLKLKISPNGGSGSEVYIGINPSSKEGFDETDYYAAPADFQAITLSLIRNELSKRNKHLFIEQRPSVGEGQRFYLELKTLPGEPVELQAEGIENIGKYNVYLLDETTHNFYNIKSERNIPLNLAHKYNAFSLFIGTDDYIAKIKQSIPPLSYQLFQNYPNPFNPSTTIRFSLPARDDISLKVYDILGKLVTTLIDNKSYEAGSYEVEFNGGDLSSGIYIVKIDAQNYTMQKKMVLLK